PPSARGGRISLDISFYRTTGDAKNAKRRHTVVGAGIAALRPGVVTTRRQRRREHRGERGQTGPAVRYRWRLGVNSREVVERDSSNKTVWLPTLDSNHGSQPETMA